MRIDALVPPLFSFSSQEAVIFDSVLNSFEGKDEETLVSQISDLARSRYFNLLFEAKSNLAYNDRIETEAPILAQYLLLDYAVKFARCQT